MSNRGIHTKEYWARIKSLEGKKLISKDKVDLLESVKKHEKKFEEFQKKDRRTPAQKTKEEKQFKQTSDKLFTDVDIFLEKIRKAAAEEEKDKKDAAGLAKRLEAADKKLAKISSSNKEIKDKSKSIKKRLE